MKLKNLLPEFAKEKTTLWLMGGNEVLARNKGGRGWEKKVGRCSQCGKCCGKCPYLKETAPGYFVCSPPEEHPWQGQPWACVRGSGENIEGCTIKYKKVK